MQIIQDYLNKRGVNGPWKIDPQPQNKFHQSVVIPAFGELELLPHTLNSLDKNDASIQKNTLVVVVVNNAENSPKSILKNNQTTLKILSSKQYNFTLGVVDAASPKLELPTKQAGVGQARKIGMDLALPHLSSTESLIFCTDADTIVSKNYIEKVVMYFDKTKTQAAVVGFRHLESNNKKQEETIRQYEKYLLTTSEKMRDASSPYGYVAMGSTMVCSVEAYCSVGGMPRKKATEDFYFLQELTKYCGVHTIPNILVHPSPRQTSRVYLGTGFRMAQTHQGLQIKSLYYSKHAFSLLQQWITLGTTAWEVSLDELLKITESKNKELKNFLLKEGIKNIWKNLQSSSPSENHFTKQFHRWFDGFKTIRFLKHFT